MTGTAPPPDDVHPGLVAVPRPSAHSFVLDGEIVVYDEDGGTMHHLNPQASLIWQCLDGSGPLSDLVTDLSDAYGVDPAEMERDVLTLVGQLAANRLLDRVGPAEDPEPSTDGADLEFLPEPPAP